MLSSQIVLPGSTVPPVAAGRALPRLVAVTRRDSLASTFVTKRGWSVGEITRLRCSSTAPVVPSRTNRLNSEVAVSPSVASKSRVAKSTRARSWLAHVPGFAAVKVIALAPVPTLSEALAGLAPPPESARKRRTTTAIEPPLRKKSRTEKPSAESFQSPPYSRSKSAKLVTVTGRSVAPRAARPTKAVTEVATPVIVRTPLGTSST